MQEHIKLDTSCACAPAECMHLPLSTAAKPCMDNCWCRALQAQERPCWARDIERQGYLLDLEDAMSILHYSCFQPPSPVAALREAVLRSGTSARLVISES